MKELRYSRCVMWRKRWMASPVLFVKTEGMFLSVESMWKSPLLYFIGHRNLEINIRIFEELGDLVRKERCIKSLSPEPELAGKLIMDLVEHVAGSWC